MPTPLREVYLIGCSKQKRAHSSPARDLYTSPLFRLSLAYAKTRHPAEIVILSAQHGLVSLDTNLSPYNATLRTFTRDERTNWYKRVAKQLQTRFVLPDCDFIFLTGELYYRDLLPDLPHYQLPLDRLPIGKRLQYLKTT